MTYISKKYLPKKKFVMKKDREVNHILRIMKSDEYWLQELGISSTTVRGGKVIKLQVLLYSSAKFSKE
jgi:hypothetical protein